MLADLPGIFEEKRDEAVFGGRVKMRTRGVVGLLLIVAGSLMKSAAGFLSH